MLHYILVFILLSVVSFLYIKIAAHFNIIDKPNNRSSHTVSTIRGGGVLFLLAIIYFFFSNNFQYPYFVLGVFLVAIISFIDDLVTLSSKIRLPFQFIAVGLVLLQIGLLNSIVFYLLLLIVGVGFINIYNFMDGINGITGLYSIVVLLGLFLINTEVAIINQNLILYLLLSLIVFGYYNFRKKARFFAGDIGSISIAITLFFIGFWMMIALQSPMISLLILVYGIDATCTLIYRKSIGENITEPHRHHLYQKLVDILQFSHIKVALLYAFIQLVINVLVYKTYQLDIKTQLGLATIIILLFIMVYIISFYKIQKFKNGFRK